jgi:transmembrane sensor
MSHSETYIAHLLLKQVSGELTPAEELVLQEWRALSADNAQLYDELIQPASLQSRLREFEEATAQAALVQAPVVKTGKVLYRHWWRYAAAFLILLGSSALFLTRTRKTDTITVSKPVEIASAGHKATLTLADGTVISLDSSSGGAIAQQGNSSIVKMPDGTIRYDKKGTADAEVMMNTMSTPKGGQYRLILPDGTIVWLNAASSVTYPAAFAAGARNIKMTGEAWFEVAPEKGKPFMVDINGEGFAEVLGTAFNINAYKDNGTVKTTLVNGKLRVRNAPIRQTAADAVVLLPGQQAIQETHSLQVKNDVNLEQVLAWKNGIFDFNGASFRQLMMEVERWYDVDVKYEGAIPDIRFKGKMDRAIKLAGVIRFLNDYGVHAQLEGRILIIKGK